MSAVPFSAGKLYAARRLFAIVGIFIRARFHSTKPHMRIIDGLHNVSQYGAHNQSIVFTSECD